MVHAGSRSSYYHDFTACPLRVSLLLKLVLARGGSYLVEQPSSSLLGWYPRFADLDIDCCVPWRRQRRRNLQARVIIGQASICSPIQVLLDWEIWCQALITIDCNRFLTQAGCGAGCGMQVLVVPFCAGMVGICRDTSHQTVYTESYILYLLVLWQ